MHFGASKLKASGQKNDSARADAMAVLGLLGPFSESEVRAAFRSHLKSAHPDLTGGTDTRLRRLIQARDLLISDVSLPKQAIERATHLPRHDACLPLHVTLEQAISGGEIDHEVPALETTPLPATLTSLTQTRRVRLSLPAGLRSGDRVRLKTTGAMREDLYFRVIVAGGADTWVWGDDIWMAASLDSALFREGGQITLATPRGAQPVDIPRHLAHGASLCLNGLGLPATETARAGNLYIRLDVKPEQLRPAVQSLNTFRQRWAAQA